MGLLGSEHFDSMRDLITHQLQDLYDAEARLISTYPKMIDKASDPQLKQQLTSDLEMAKVQRERLKGVMERYDINAERETCEAMKGLIKEAGGMLDAKGEPAVIDAALIMSAQRLLHYKLAGYGSARCQFAAEGRDDLAGLLDQTVDEVHASDKSFAELATSVINKHAAAA